MRRESSLTLDRGKISGKKSRPWILMRGNFGGAARFCGFSVKISVVKNLVEFCVFLSGSNSQQLRKFLWNNSLNYFLFKWHPRRSSVFMEISAISEEIRVDWAL